MLRLGRTVGLEGSPAARQHLDVGPQPEDDLFTYDNTDDGRGWWTRYTHMVDGGFYGYPWDYWPDDATPAKVAVQIMTGTPGQPYTLWRMSEYGGGSPCGAVSYNEDALPAEYHNNNFHCEWGKSRANASSSSAGADVKVVEARRHVTDDRRRAAPVGICVNARRHRVPVTTGNTAAEERRSRRKSAGDTDDYGQLNPSRGRTGRAGGSAAAACYLEISSRGSPTRPQGRMVATGGSRNQVAVVGPDA